MNKVFLQGYLGADPELRFTATGTPVCNLRLATNEGWTDKAGQRQTRTEWHTVVVWGNDAKAVAQYKGEGDWLSVEGSNRTREWEDRNGNKRYTTEVYAVPGGLEYGPKTDKAKKAKSQQNQQSASEQSWSPPQGFDNDQPMASQNRPDDDIPF